MWADVRAAFSFLTILPLGFADRRKPGWSLAAYPLVGLAIGGLLALLTFAPFPAPVTAFVVLAGWVIITGGLHLDGFGDSCDGVLATDEPARRLAIMKDPRTGVWAVIGLIVLLLGKWTTLGAVAPALLLLPPVVGRWAMVLAAVRFPYARREGLGGYFRDGLGGAQMAIATCSMLAVTLACALWIDPRALLMPIAGAGLVLVIGGWAARRLGGGLTGDSYGALCELSELVCLLIGSAAWAK